MFRHTLGGIFCSHFSVKYRQNFKVDILKEPEKIKKRADLNPFKTMYFSQISKFYLFIFLVTKMHAHSKEQPKQDRKVPTREQTQRALLQLPFLFLSNMFLPRLLCGRTHILTQKG